MTGSYNKIASSYDFLSRLVFGKAQVKAQTNQLSYLKNCQTILIVGGGTGWILEEVSKVSKAQITYVEYASKMLELAKNRSYANEVDFVLEDAQYLDSDQRFDAILTPFLFDNFDREKAELVFSNLDSLLKENGLWLYVDFKVDGKSWKNMLLKSMQLFFRLIGAINTNQLVEMGTHFSKKQYVLLEECFYYGRFIAARVYKKH